MTYFSSKNLTTKFICRYRDKNSFKVTDRNGNEKEVYILDGQTEYQIYLGSNKISDNDAIESVKEMKQKEHEEYMEWLELHPECKEYAE